MGISLVVEKGEEEGERETVLDDKQMTSFPKEVYMRVHVDV